MTFQTSFLCQRERELVAQHDVYGPKVAEIVVAGRRVQARQPPIPCASRVAVHAKLIC
jgi:hypothetical protein